MKALGPGHWLVGSAVDPPSVFPAFNGQTLLSQPASASEPDPWLRNDPWKQCRTSRGLPAAPNSAAAAPTVRELAGPTEKRFQEQALEQTLQNVQTQ